MTAVAALEVAQELADALGSGDADVVAGFAPRLADGARLVSIRGRREGRDDVVAGLADAGLLGMFGQATWSPPTVGDDGTRVEMRATVPAALPVGGFDVTLQFDGDGQVQEIHQQMLPPAPLEPTPLALGDDVRDLLAGALSNRTPTIVAYVAPDGRPHVSLRATTQLLGPDRIGMWIRDPSGGLLAGIAANPNLTIWYRDPEARTNYQFYGRARRDDDERVRAEVFDHSPEPEQNMDPSRRGVAVVVDLDRVEGSGPSGRVLMVRDA